VKNLTPSQESLKSHLELQLRLFNARDWTAPRFPWPLIVAPTNAGVSTTIKELGQPVLILDAIQWGIVGGRSTPTLINVLKWAETNTGIILIKNLHLLNAITLDVPWFRAVQSEITSLLDGFISSELVADMPKLYEIAKQLPRKVFFIGHGNWDLDAKKQPIMTTEDAYRDSHNKELSTHPELIARFHSRATVLDAPNKEDWKTLLKTFLTDCGQSHIDNIAKRKVAEGASLAKLGEVISDWMLDRPLPDKPSKATFKPVIMHEASFTEGRLKLLLCKIYGDASRFPQLRDEIEATISALDSKENVAPKIGNILTGLNQNKYGIPDEDIQVFFSKSVATAASLASKMSYSLAQDE